MPRGKSRKSRSSGSKKAAGGGLKDIAVSGAKALLGGGSKKGGGGKKRGRGPQYWANKVIVAKLKKKYRSITYGGVMR